MGQTNLRFSKVRPWMVRMIEQLPSKKQDPRIPEPSSKAGKRPRPGGGWLVPLVLLAVLFTANEMRWHENLASKTLNGGSGFVIAEWSQDRWTGYYWISRYGCSEERGIYAHRMPITQEGGSTELQIRRTTEALTWCWRIAVLAAAAWLVFALRRE